MKQFLLTAMAFVIGLQICDAQNCSQFVSSMNGKKLTYANQDAKGKQQGTVTYASTKKNSTTVAFHTDVLDRNGKSIGSGDSEMTCNGETINVDMKSFLPPASAKQFGKMDMKADGKSLAYPLNLKAGQSLTDGSANIIISNNGSEFGNITIDITNRKVDRKESLTTPAGSFDCFVINYDISVRAKVMGISVPVNMHVTEWFAPKMGRMVKSETNSKNGKQMGIMQLIAIN